MAPSSLSRRRFGQVAGASALAAGVQIAQGAPALASPGRGPEAPVTAGGAGDEYLIGCGLYDITGAAAETGSFGYAAGQTMTGLQERLFAHAFVIGANGGKDRVVFVSVDMGAVFQSVKLGVVVALRERFGGLYTDENVCISATHTHSGNAGQSHDTLFQIAGADGAGYGYDERNLQAAVTGIVEAIARAHANLEPGRIELQTGTLPGVTKNRALPAYRANKDAASFPTTVNEEVVQLKLTAADGTPRGLINWFAIHGTSFSLKNTLLSGDNKGYAQYFFEQRMGAHPRDPKGFVAAFAQADEGDVVSVQGNSFSSPGYQGSADEWINVEADGRAQLAKAVELFNAPGIPASGPVAVRGRWADFGRYTVKAAFTGGAGDQRLPVPARGWSFAAGAPNGPSNIPGIGYGMTRGSFSLIDAGDALGNATNAGNKPAPAAEGTLVRMAFSAVGKLVGADDPAQGAKAVLLPDGKFGWAPLQIPVQVMRIGQLAVIAVPGEPTTMSGRRIRRQVLEALKGAGVTHAVVAGLSNQYMGYITTPEEYGKQYYEGASTEFGPHQLGALLQEYDALAKGLASGSPTPGVTPRDTGKRPPSRPGVVLDDKPAGQEFGHVLEQPKASYRPGGIVTAVFRGGHPKNDFRTMGTFLKVQRQEGGAWKDVLDDHDWDTVYRWEREGASFSRCTVEWRIRPGTPAGTYRLVQTGDWKNGWNGRVTAYTGASRPFTVVA